MDNGVSFNQEDEVQNIRIVTSAPSGMLAWLLKKKLVKSAKQGEFFLLIFAVVAIALAILIALLTLSYSENTKDVPLGAPIPSSAAPS